MPLTAKDEQNSDEWLSFFIKLYFVVSERSLEQFHWHI
jgi:hypothetical protein